MSTANRLADMYWRDQRQEQTRILDAIHGVLKAHARLRAYCSQLDIRIERSAVVVRGNLPSSSLQADLVKAIRQAGVLWNIDNEVSVN